MSYQWIPGYIRTPYIPGFEYPSGVWRGVGNDEGYISLAASRWGHYIITHRDNLCYSLYIDGNEYRPIFTDVNGYIVWHGTLGNVYYTQSYGWVFADYFAGYEPYENRAMKDGRTIWLGDRFYTLPSPPSSPGGSAVLTPRGSIHDSTPLTITNKWPRWTCDTEFGTFTATDGVSGERRLGLPRFTGGGQEFVRSINKTNGHFTYGGIHYVNGKWVIGTPNSASGWHEGSESQVGSSVQFRFCKPEGSTITGEDITVSFKDFIIGTMRDTAYLGSVAIWR